MRRLILLIATACLLPSCKNNDSLCSGKQVACPAFSDDMAMLWLPYKINQQLLFSTSAGDRDTFRMIGISFSKSYNTTVSGNSPDCYANGEWASDLDSSKSYKLSVSESEYHDQYSNTSQKTVSISIKRASFNGRGFSDTGLVLTPDNIGFASRFYSSKIINSKQFINIQEIYKDTSKFTLKSRDIYKIWIAKNIGLAG